MPENWNFRLCAIASDDLGALEQNSLELNDTSASGTPAVTGKLGADNLTEGKILDPLPDYPRRIVFKVQGTKYKARFLRFSDGSGLMWGHVRRPKRPKTDADEDAVWVATKGGGTLVDSKLSGKLADKKPKMAAKKKRLSRRNQSAKR